MRKLKGFLANALLVSGAIVLSVVVAFMLDGWLDLGLKMRVGRMFETDLQRPEPIMYVYDNRTGWRLNPLTQYHRERSGPFLGLAGLERFDTKLRVNSDGFIDREHFLKTSHYRIAFVGNSWVEAVQQEYADRFTPLTEDYVFAQSDHGKVVEIMNFGVSNLAPAQAYGVIRSFVLKYRPDEVWLFVSGVDLRANTPIVTPPPFGPTFEYADEQENELKDIHFGFVDPPAYGSWKRQRDLGKFALAATSFRQVIPYLYSDERSLVFDRVWRDMKLSVSLIRKTLAEQGIRVRLVYLPREIEVDTKLWAEYGRGTVKALGRELTVDPSAGERRFAALARELGIEFISLLPLSREKGAQEMFADHFTRKGHHWVAEFLAKQIIETTPPTTGVAGKGPTR